MDSNPTSYIGGDPLTLPVPTKEGYTFDGWISNSLLQGSETVALYNSTTGPQEFWARWAIKSPFVENFEGPTSEGVALADWSFLNGTQVNKWHIGNAPTGNVTNSAYITSGGTSGTWNYVYDNATRSTVHLYRDILLSANGGTTNTLSFDWSGLGEAVNDVLTVYLVPTTSAILDGYVISGALPLGTYNGSAAWRTEKIIVPANDSKQRLLFTWVNNDNGTGGPTPIAIDNVSVYRSRLVRITLDPSDGVLTGGVSYLDVMEGDSVGTELKDPTKEGAVFYRWYDGDIPYNHNSKVLRDDFTLKAVWNAKEFEITYELNGGYFDVPADLTYITERELVLKNPVVASGDSIFVGWYNTSDFSTSLGGRKVEYIAAGCTGDTTLYAKWSKVYHITYNLHGGKNPIDSIATYFTEQTPLNLQRPEREGYSFFRWTPNGAVISDADIHQGFTGDILFEAEWTPDNYTVTYVTNGGTNPTTQVYNFTIESSDVLPKAPTKANSDFLGWYSTPGFVDSTRVDTIPAGSSASVTLYAKWIERFTVKFDLQEGSWDSPDGTIPSITVLRGDSLTQPTPNPTRNQYTFYRWFVDSTFAIPWNFDTDRVRNNMTLYARWATMVESFEDDGPDWQLINGDATNRWAIGSDTCYGGSKAAYISNDLGVTNAYTPDAAGVTHLFRDFEFPLVDDNKAYRLVFNWKGRGAVGHDYMKVYIVAATPEFIPVANRELEAPALGRSYYNGEYNDSEAWQKEESIFLPVDYSGSRKRLVFSWVNDNTSGGANPPIAIDDVAILDVSHVAVTFDAQGGVYSPAVVAVPYGHKVPEPTHLPIYTGKYFLGWFMDKAYTIPWDFDNEEVTRNTTLYAKWVPAVVVSFNAQNGTSLSLDTVAQNAKVNRPDKPVIPGKYLYGWSRYPEKSDPIWDFERDTVTSYNFTLYAHWVEAVVVTFYSHDAAMEVYDTIAINKTVARPPVDPVRDGYYFEGWYDNLDKTNPWRFTNIVSNSMTIYAKWYKKFLDEDFESGTGTVNYRTDHYNDWQIVNSTSARDNNWCVSSGTGYGRGTRAAYITDSINNPVPAVHYNIRRRSVVHLYRDVHFEAQDKDFTYRLTFNWKCFGEQNRDNLRIYLIDPTVTEMPRKNAPDEEMDALKPFLIGVCDNREEWATKTIVLPGGVPEERPESLFDKDMRLLFTWTNDAFFGYENFPAAIDNILIVESQEEVTHIESPPTDVKEVTAATTGVQIFPNPAHAKVTILNAAGKSVSVFNSLGVKVFEKFVPSDEEQVSLASWASGVYLVRVSENDKVIETLKLLKD
ncbi:hypothetical protein AGMMS49982_05570 [Bacteroidia bacterium]|nr:hypothetical protein AGMMS49982_05570 [Bacteroidia bacterium]